MNYLKIIQLALAVLLIIVILLQNRGAGLSGFLGGTGNVYLTKRGLEKKLFVSTIVIASLFLGVSLLVVLI